MDINGTVTPWREDDRCGHDWYDLWYEDRVYQNLTCPASGCPVKCRVGGAPPCLHPEDPSNDPQTFWIYFALRMTGTFFLSSSFTMMVGLVAFIFFYCFLDMMSFLSYNAFLIYSYNYY